MNNNKIGNIISIEEKDNLEIKSETSPFSECIYFTKFYEERIYKKFIKNTERLIRNSKEYKMYIELLKNNLKALNFDNILSSITSNDADIELHHYPFSLYDLIDVVSTNKFIEKEKFTSFTIGKEIMQLHFMNLVGLVPLTITNHELAHNGDLFISEKQIFGDYKKIIEIYTKGIGVELLEKIEKMEELSSKNMPSDIRGIY